MESAYNDAMKSSNNREMVVTLSAIEMNKKKKTLEAAYKKCLNADGVSKLDAANAKKMSAEFEKNRLKQEVVDAEMSVESVSKWISDRKVR